MNAAEKIKADHQLMYDMAKGSCDALIRAQNEAKAPNKDHEEDEDEGDELEDGYIETAAGGA
eukprot:4576837-Pyramimonas_sp.AAC.1